MTSAAPDLKLLLDQNFPHPVFDVSAVDATVSVTPVRVFDASLTRRKTPDWLIYLRASQAGFDAVVTRDRSQLDDPEELVTLVDTGLNVITWRHPVEDSIQEWGQLLAYMSLIRRRLAGQRSQVIQLPKRPWDPVKLRRPAHPVATSTMGSITEAMQNPYIAAIRT